MLDLLGKGTDRGYSMIGVGLSAVLSGSRRARTVQDPLPALDLDWATNRSLPASYGPTPSFSRASSGTYFDGQGILKSAAVNGPRFNHVYNGTSWVSKGLLVEEQRTNIVQWSDDLSSASWTKTNCSITADSIISPDGNLNGDLAEFSASGTMPRVFQAGGFSVTSGTSYTKSFFVKAGTQRWIQIVWSGAHSSRYANFDTLTMTFGTVSANVTTSVSNVGGGWYRVSATSTTTATALDYFWIYAVDSGTSGWASNSTSGGSIYVYGFQLETGSFHTSYIPTTSSTAVKSASVCQLTGTDFSSIWNSAEGTLVIEGDSVANGTTPFLSLDDNTSSERIEVYGSGTDPKVLVVDGGSTQVDIDAGTISNGTAFKLAFSYKLNDFAVSLNGGAVATVTVGTLPTVDRLRIGSNQAGNYLNGHIARLRYYPTRLTNAKLQELST